jgi:hypothetical protein
VDLARKLRLGCAASIGIAAIAIAESTAQCGEVAAQLDYMAVPGCPAARDFEAVVTQRLGYSPFRPDAPERVVVRIEASGRALEGRLEWRNATDQWIGDRLLPSRSGDCGELVRVMGFALALQVQLMAGIVAPAETPTAEEPQTPQTATTPSAPPTEVVAPPSPLVNVEHETRLSPSGTGPSIAAGAGAAVGIGATPTAVAIGRLFGTVAWSHVAVELGAELSVPSVMHRADGAGFSEQLLLGSLAACGLRSPWSACLVGKVGEIRVTGEGVDVPASSSGVLIQTGLRLGVTYPLGRHAHVAAHVDGLALLNRGVVTLDSMAAWTTPRVAANLGVDVGVRFP